MKYFTAQKSQNLMGLVISELPLTLSEQVKYVVMMYVFAV